MDKDVNLIYKMFIKINWSENEDSCDDCWNWGFENEQFFFLWGWRCGRKSSKRGFKDGDKISLFAHRDSSANILFKGVNKKKIEGG
jgi:hypothetical protein